MPNRNPLAFFRRNKLWSLPALILLAGAAAFFWWRSKQDHPQYVTAPLTKGNILRSVTTTGALNPVVTVQVGSYVSGTIKALGCDFNTEVVIGQNCATIDPVPFQLIVDQDKAQVGTAVAQLNKDKAALVYAKIAFERDSKLLAESTVSQDAVDSDLSVYMQAKEQIGVDQATIVDKQAALKAAQVNLAYTNIVSPVVGTVITRSIDVGQTVAASLASPTLFLIGKDLTHMQVDTNVSEADVGEVKMGQDAFFTVQAFPGKSFRGKVMQIRRGPITVQNVVTYDVVIAVDNPDRSLFPGMTADTHIVIDEHDDVLRVPLPAVRFNPEGVARAHGGERHLGEARTSAQNDDKENRSGENLVASEGEEHPRGERNSRDGEAGKSGDGEEHRRGEGRKWADGEGKRSGGENKRSADGEEHARGSHREHKEADEHRGRIWVLSDAGTLRMVAVTIGIDDGALVEVSGEGLQPGDKVVVNEVGSEPRRTGATPAQNNGPGQTQLPRQGMRL